MAPQRYHAVVGRSHRSTPTAEYMQKGASDILVNFVDKVYLPADLDTYRQWLLLDDNDTIANEQLLREPTIHQQHAVIVSNISGTMVSAIKDIEAMLEANPLRLTIGQKDCVRRTILTKVLGPTQQLVCEPFSTGTIIGDLASAENVYVYRRDCTCIYIPRFANGLSDVPFSLFTHQNVWDP